MINEVIKKQAAGIEQTESQSVMQNTIEEWDLHRSHHGRVPR